MKLFLLFALFVLVQSCTHMIPIQSWSERTETIDGRDNTVTYINRPKNQQKTGMCWDFASISFLETMYNILTKTRYTLSVEQVGDNIKSFFETENYNDTLFQDCKQSVSANSDPSFNGFFPECALVYISKKGIMTEYDYPFSSGIKIYYDNYNISLVTPVGVRSIHQVDILNIQDKYSILESLFKHSVVIGGIDSNDSYDQVIDDIHDQNYKINHAVLLTGLYQCQDNNEYYIQIQNSWGIVWDRYCTSENEFFPPFTFKTKMILKVFKE